MSTPFDRPLVILISQQRMKTDRSEYPYRVVLKCFAENKAGNAIPGMILRENPKGVFAWNQRHETHGYPLFYGIPIRKNEWLTYSFFFDPIASAKFRG